MGVFGGCSGFDVGSVVAGIDVGDGDEETWSNETDVFDENVGEVAGDSAVPWTIVWWGDLQRETGLRDLPFLVGCWCLGCWKWVI